MVMEGMNIEWIVYPVKWAMIYDHDANDDDNDKGSTFSYVGYKN